MNIFEKKMVSILQDLALNYNATGIKAEFEDEGTGFEEAMRLKELSLCSNLDLTLKLGGCSAIKDIQDAKIIGAGTLVAPMIESSYAAKKYFEAFKSVLHEDEINEMKFFINIETINGFKYMDDILQTCQNTDINGIVIGRTDFTGSLGMNKNEVDNQIIYDYAKSIASKAKLHDMEVIIGGGVTQNSIKFFKNLSSKLIDKYETRKIIFNFCDNANEFNMTEGILKALEFEIMWLKNKNKYYNISHKNDIQRINSLEKKCKEITGNKIYV